MTYTVHAGHAAQGKAFCGAVGLLDESRENRLVKDAFVKWLNIANEKVIDTTVDTGTSQRNVLEQICTKCNSVNADLNFSIHLNSGRNDNIGDDRQGGFEIYATNYTDLKLKIANSMVANMKALGFVMHGKPLKVTKDLYFLNQTKKPSLLIEICFVDDKDDYDLYRKIGTDAIGKALAEAVAGKKITQEGDFKMANVFQHTLDGGDKQKWKIERVGNKFMFKNKFNGEYLDVAGGVAKNGVNIQTYAKNSSKAQQFSIEQIKKGYSPACIAPINIVSAIDNKSVVDIAAGSKSNCANADLYSYNNTNAQKFYAIDTGDGYCIFLNVGSLKALTV